MTNRARGDASDKPSVEPILRHYGAGVVPTGTSWRNMRCCFHEDRIASAQVNTDTGYFRCFSCDFFGDGIEIVKWREGKGFSDAKRYAEELAGGHDSAGAGAPGRGALVSSRAWHQRGGGSGRPAGRRGRFGSHGG